MNTKKIAAVISILIVSNPCIASDKEDIVGTWTLDAFEVLGEDGSWEAYRGQVPDAYFKRIGSAPLGMIIYDAAGNMAVQIMGSDRAQLVSDDIVNLDASDIKPAYTGYSAYFGTYELREADGIVIHRRTGNLIPNYVGSEVQRAYQLEGDTLILSAATGSRLVWKRLH